MNQLPVQRASELSIDSAPLSHWLVEGLWSEQAVGILGGEPKCCKSFLALDLAVSVEFPESIAINHRAPSHYWTHDLEGGRASRRERQQHFARIKSTRFPSETSQDELDLRFANPQG